MKRSAAVRTTTKSVVDMRRMKRPPTHPGEILLEEFLARGLSQADAAREESDRLDIEVARKRLADPNEVPVPYQRIRKELGLD